MGEMQTSQTIERRWKTDGALGLLDWEKARGWLMLLRVIHRWEGAHGIVRADDYSRTHFRLLQLFRECAREGGVNPEAFSLLYIAFREGRRQGGHDVRLLIEAIGSPEPPQPV